jgi:hypothetical protein
MHKPRKSEEKKEAVIGEKIWLTTPGRLDVILKTYQAYRIDQEESKCT